MLYRFVQTIADIFIKNCRMETPILVLQIISIIVIMAIGVFGAYLPFFFARKKNVYSIMAYLNIASAGILIGACFIHMLPDATGELDKLCYGYPVSYVLFCVGMILMIWLSRVGSVDHEVIHRQIYEQKMLEGKIPAHSSPDDTMNTNHLNGLAGESSTDISALRLVGNPHDVTDVASKPRLSSVTDSACLSDTEAPMLSPMPAKPAKTKSCQSFKNVIVLLIGLFVHSLSAGISLGLLTTLTSAIGLSLAIMLHKWCETVATTLAGIRSNIPKKKNITFGVILSLATPIGQVIGIVIVALLGGKKDDPDTMRILNCITDFFTFFASGTFVQIVYEEVLHHDLPIESSHKRKISDRAMTMRLLSLVGGFVFMCLVSVVELVVTRH